MMEGDMYLHDYMMGGLKTELLNDRIINLDRIHTMSISNIIGLILLVLFLKNFS